MMRMVGIRCTSAIKAGWGHGAEKISHSTLPIDCRLGVCHDWEVSGEIPGHQDVIVIGGGGAGLFCAFKAAERGKRVLLLEHNERVGRKIEILRRRPMQLHQHPRDG